MLKHLVKDLVKKSAVMPKEVQIFQNNVQLAVGSLIFCTIDSTEKIGIFIGNNKVIYFEKEIIIEDLQTFTNGQQTAIIPVDVLGNSIPFEVAAIQAVQATQKNPTHLQCNAQFLVGCMTNDFTQATATTSNVKTLFKDVTNTDVFWEQWTVSNQFTQDTFFELKSLI